MSTSFLTIRQFQELKHPRFDNVMNMFKGILELAMFLMSKHLLDDNIATSQSSIASRIRYSADCKYSPQIVDAVHHAPALFTDIFFIANTAVNVRLTYAGD
jgi:hypothetical protein